MSPPSPLNPDHHAGVRNTVRVVRKELTNNSKWRFYANNGKWICPYCIAPVSKRVGKNMPDSILLHLESCKSWARGRGVPLSDTVILRRLQTEDIASNIDTNPAWRITDHTGAWFCPACQERVPHIRMHPGQPITSFIYQAVGDHLGRCSQWRSDLQITQAHSDGARSRALYMAQLIPFVQERLQTPLWRHVDARGLWICTYCLGHLSLTRSGSAPDWSQSAEGIAQHLLCNCAPFSANPAVTKSDALILQAAQNTTNTPISNTPPGTPFIPTPTASEIRAVTPSHVPVSPPIASPVSPFSRRVAAPLMRVSSPTLTAAAASLPVNSAALTPSNSVPHISDPSSIAGTPDLAAVLDASEISEFSENAPPLNWMDAAEDNDKHSVPARERSDIILARGVQKNFMQKPPDFPGLRFAVRFEPCADISGDFYEFVHPNDGRVGFAMGDVSGHGIQAGLIMSMAKKTLQIYASSGSSPADTLSKVNDSLCRDLDGKMFISMVYGLLDPERRTITWARAGHNPPLLLSRDGNIREINPAGMVIGMKEGPVYRNFIKEEVTPLESGDCILMYTDGITEVMNLQQEEFGLERLHEVLRRYAGDGPEALVEHVMDLIRHFRGPQPLADDLTLLALAVE